MKYVLKNIGSQYTTHLNFLLKFIQLPIWTTYLQNTLAPEIFSSSASKGTTTIPEPSVDVISIKLNVVFCTVVENGGGSSFGKPGSTGSENY